MREVLKALIGYDNIQATSHIPLPQVWKKSEGFNLQSIYLAPVLNNMFLHIDLVSA